MAVAQDDFKQYRDNAYEGQIANIELCKIKSRTVETAAIKPGRAVVNGTAARSCAGVGGSTTAAQIIGISVRSMAVENNAAGSDEYGVGDVASIMEDGKIFAKCVGGAAKGATVYVVINVAGGDELGQLRGTADSTNTIQLNQAKWTEAVAAGDIGEISLHGILTA